MKAITSKWLHERGGLHDATLLGIHATGSVFEISFNDEWVNERGLSKPIGQETPVTLIADGLVVEGKPDAAKGGWVSQITLVANRLTLEFCDRPPLSFQITSAWWCRST